jgi:hypothetical protein
VQKLALSAYNAMNWIKAQCLHQEETPTKLLGASLETASAPHDQRQREGEHDSHSCPAERHDEWFALHSVDDQRRAPTAAIKPIRELTSAIIITS